jgi:uncharacterized protein (DUF3084 family)
MSDENCCGACGYPIHANKDKACDWCRQTADRIEALTAKVKLMDDLDIINGEKIEALTKERDEALNQWDSARHSVDVLEKRVAFVEEERRKTFQALLKVTKIHDDVETKLAKAVEALREVAGECGCSTARAIIAEIEGEKE